MSTHHEHVVDPKKEARGYLLTLIGLLFLTGLTVAASYVDFGQGNIVIALTIATMKATLVALFFMHLAHDRPINGLIAIAGFIFLGLFLMFDLLDVTTRRDAVPQNLPPVVQMPASAAPATTPSPKPVAPAPAATPAPAAAPTPAAK